MDGKEGHDDVKAIEHAPQEHAFAQQQSPNLLDVVLDRLKVNVDDGTLCSRIIICGALTSTESCKGLFETLLGEEWGHTPSTFTGILVETPKNFLHFLEGPPQSILKYIGDIQSNLEQYDTVKDIVVASYTDDIGQRAFSKWTLVEQSLQGGDGPKTREKLKQNIVDMSMHLIDLGGITYQKERLQMMQCLASLKSTNPDIIPSISSIEAVHSTPGKDYCLTIGEFTHLYAKPINVQLHGEMVWPPQPPLGH